MAFTQELILSLSAPFRGLRFLLKNKSLWLLALGPFLLGLGWSFFSLLSLIKTGGTSEWYLKTLGFVFTGLVQFSIFMVQFYIAISSPILDLISERTEEINGNLPKSPPLIQQVFSPKFWIKCTKALKEALKLLCFKMVLWFFAFGFSFIPQAGSLLFFFFMGLATGLDFLDYPLARKEFSLKEKINLLKQKAAPSCLFCLCVFALFACPGLGGLMLVPAVIGGALFCHEVLLK